MGTIMAQTDRAAAEMSESAVAAEAAEAAAYIASMARELCEIAARHELGFLVYLLTMTTEEAAAIRGGSRPRQESDAA